MWDMEREELERIMREAAQHIGLAGVISYLLDWTERVFYMEISKGIADEIAEADAIRARGCRS